MIEVKNVTKQFGHIRAVNNLSFHVKKGEVLGFLGPNGAGKTTTMRMITGFFPPTSGSVSVCGHDVAADPVAAKTSIGYLPENAPVYDSMIVADFLKFAGETRGYRGKELKELIDKAITTCRLEKVRKQSIGTLSKGYKQRTCFAQAILHDPPVLIMDEPTDGLDPNQKFVVRQLISEMASEKAIIISTHILEEVDAVCTRAIIISNGTMAANGTPDELRKKSETGRLDDVFRMLTLDKEDK